MDNQQRTKELSWLAGFIEADGSLQMMVQLKENGLIKLTPLLSICGCEEDLIERCAFIVKSSFDVNGHRSCFSNTGSNKRPVYRFTVSKQAQHSRVLPELMEYMWGRKKEIAGMLLEFCHSRMDQPKKTWQGFKPYSQRELEMARRISQLNSVGLSETKRKAVERVDKALSQMI